MLRVIELFAGVGGFRLGLEATNEFEIVWGNQWEPSKKAQDAFDCYARQFNNRGIHSNEDISTVNEKTLRDMNIDVLVGGFPCQDYSVAGAYLMRKGFKEKKEFYFGI